MPSRSPPVSPDTSPTQSPITSKKIKGEENYLLNPVDEANLRLELKETKGNLKKTTEVNLFFVFSNFLLHFHMYSNVVSKICVHYSI